jgi:hypothetical protein
MVKLDNFNADEVEPAGSFEPLPAGKYTVVIEDSDNKDNKAGTGSYLKLTYNVVEGPYAGRKLFENLNLHFDDEAENEKHAMAVKIAKGALRQICFAVGNHTPQETEELHDIPFLVTVGIKKGNDEFPEPQNVIRKREALSPDDAPPAAAAPPAGSPAAAVKKSGTAGKVSGGDRPWVKKK